MSISGVLTALQVRHAALADVNWAPEFAPDTLPSGNCPCILVDALEGTTQWKAHAGNVSVCERTYMVRLLTSPTGLGTPEQNRALTVSILDDLLESYRTTASVGTSATIAIERAGAVKDSGPRPYGNQGPIQAFGESFYGAEIRLLIEERYD